MSEIALVLFGPPRLARDGVTVGLSSRKALALLAYLAVTDARHSRPTLAALLWPESDRPRALKSLRYTLWILRKALERRWLVADRETVGLDGSQERAVDVVRFRHLLAACRAHGHSVRQTCSECLPLLGEAVELYQGDFLAGFTLPDSVEFDAWQSLETEALRQELVAALERLVDGWALQGDAERAGAYAKRWLVVDPLDEGAHRALMGLYAGSGRMTAALRQYEACAQVLREELGVSPSRQTEELYLAVKGGRAPPLGVPSPPASRALPAARHNLPPQPTPFIGREAELGQVARLLGEASCRLVSVVGPGGIGKTRLAMQAAAGQVGRLASGVYFVPLVSLSSPELLPSTILDVLEVPQSGSLHPREQLLRVLRERQELLILDNFEHLLEGATLVSEMLGAGPDIKLLVTSRERLNLREEWLLPLHGMPFPGNEEIGEAREEESSGVGAGLVSEESMSLLQGYSAVEFFLQCARRVRPDFSLATVGASWVGRICQLVEGMPLAIELAAPWIRLMSCEEIAQEIERGLTLLTSSLRDVPERHRSMRAVFDHSCALLSDGEREVMARLSVFRGGLRREAAEAVAGATLAQLSALVDSSWLSVDTLGRYQVHELIRQYAWERLREDHGEAEVQRVQGRHSTYYAAFLGEREPHLLGWGQREAFAEIVEDMANVWAAWNWAVESGDVESIGQCVSPLKEVAELRGWHYDVNQAFEGVTGGLRKRLDPTADGHERASQEETRLVLAETLRSQALECYKLGHDQRVKALCEEGLEHLHHAGQGQRQRILTAMTYVMLGAVVWLQGDHSASIRLLREGLALADEANYPRGRTAARMVLGRHLTLVGQYQEAEELLQQGLAIAEDAGDLRYQGWGLSFLSAMLSTKGDHNRASLVASQSLHVRQQLGDRAGAADSHLNLGVVATALMDYEQAMQHYQDALAIAKEVADPNHEHRALNGLGTAAAALGRHAEAKRRFEEALALANDLGRPLSDSLVGLGYAACALGESERSREHFCRALELAMKAGRTPTALGAAVGLASLSVEEGEPQCATELLSLALHHPATTSVTRNSAQELLSELESKLPSEVFAAAVERGRARELDDVIAEVLRA